MPSYTLRAGAEANAWTSLLSVQSDPTYRALVGEVLESVRPRVEAVDPGMCHRGGWIFITSPNTVTPFHFDKEHNFILQIHGRKRIYRSEEHTSELQSLMRISYAVFCLKKKNTDTYITSQQ